MVHGFKHYRKMKQMMKHLITNAACMVGITAALACPAVERTNAVKKIEGIEFARPGGVALLLDLYLPEGVEKPPLVMFIHGGGWNAGDRKTCKLDWAAQHGYAVASIEYRLSQEALFPAQIHDCKGALRWLRAHADKYGYDATRVVVSGSSAGGHLAALMGTSGGVAALEGATAGHTNQSARVQGVIDFYGPSDLVSRIQTQPEKSEIPEGNVYRLLGGKGSENLEAARSASPVTHISADDPPLLILHGDKDTTVYLDQSEILRDRYQAAGLEVKLVVKPGGKHGFSPRTAEEREVVLTALRKWLGEAAANER